MKKFIALILIALFLIPTLPCMASSINLFIDGVQVGFDYSTGYPINIDGRVFVPLRAAMESFGATVDWDDETKTAFVYKGTTTVRCEIGKNYIYRNNVKIYNDAAALVNNGRTYLPIRIVLESFGADVAWDGAVRVTSGDGASLVHTVENSPSVTTNYWPVWNNALSLKSSGDYHGAISQILSISNVFLKSNPGASSAMLYKHLGECYSNICDYSKASACFKREAYYWNLTPGMRESYIDANRRANLIKTNMQLYVKSTDLSMGAKTDFGVELEPSGGVYLGAYAEGDTNIYNPYSPNMFYMDTFPDLIGREVAAYLIYLPYGTPISHYTTHISHAISKNKIIQVSLEPHGGLWQVNADDGYLVNLAKDMESTDCKLMLRFASEMNDTTSTWYTTDTNLYIEKFRIVADIFQRYAPSVPVIWSPNFYPSDTMDDYYPGDEYVDYVGISSYMMHQPITDPLGQGVDRSRWSNQLDTLYSLYGYKKPIIISESGASYMDYDTWADITPFATAQIKDFYTYLPIKYPNVKMCFVFDSDRTRQKFSLSNNSSYLSGFKEGIASDLYLGTVGQDRYKYDYYELGNNVPVKAERTQLCSYVQTPANNVAYVNYYVNGVYLATSYSAPYTVDIDFSGYKGNTNITVDSFDANNMRITSHSVKVFVK